MHSWFGTIVISADFFYPFYKGQQTQTAYELIGVWWGEFSSNKEREYEDVVKLMSFLLGLRTEGGLPKISFQDSEMLPARSILMALVVAH